MTKGCGSPLSLDSIYPAINSLDSEHARSVMLPADRENEGAGRGNRFLLDTSGL